MTINIKGKDYMMVNERLTIFRDKYPDYSLTSEILEINDVRVLMIAKIANKEGIVVATGHAYEDAGSTFINKTSYVENCETSAWGRALANLGIGIDTSVASADEVTTAINNQNKQHDLIGDGEELCQFKGCNQVLTENVASFSISKYGKALCYAHQKVEESKK